MRMDKIDFVVMWVDGNDKAWLKEKAKYQANDGDLSASSNRFRDWDLMKYWFRGIEKYASWVNHIYFVTCGHYPEWLNVNHSKLTVVNHEDYIPKKVLPTFNSNVIEMHLHRIDTLSEQFVLFNDDMFIIAPTSPTDFFVEGKPCDSALLGALSVLNAKDTIFHILANDMGMINAYFSKKEVLKKHWRKFFSNKYGTELLLNLLLLPFRYFSSFRGGHLPASLLKKTYKEIWELEPNLMYNATSERFRSNKDVNHFLIKYWNMCKGNFYPRRPSWGEKFEIGSEEGVYQYIKKQCGKVVCLNDSREDIDFERIQHDLKIAFESILPEKSSFEK